VQSSHAVHAFGEGYAVLWQRGWDGGSKEPWMGPAAAQVPGGGDGSRQCVWLGLVAFVS
jgi:hypothetical protein